jgi:hypothetical protein
VVPSEHGLVRWHKTFALDTLVIVSVSMEQAVLELSRPQSSHP